MLSNNETTLGRSTRPRSICMSETKRRHIDSPVATSVFIAHTMIRTAVNKTLVKQTRMSSQEVVFLSPLGSFGSFLALSFR